MKYDLPSLSQVTPFETFLKNENKQAGAELGQAQYKIC